MGAGTYGGLRVDLASIRGRPSVPVPSGKHKDKLAASVSAVISMCPDAMFAATLKFGSGVFTAADKVSTKPIPREDLLRGFLCHGEASGEPLASEHAPASVDEVVGMVREAAQEQLRFVVTNSTEAHQQLHVRLHLQRFLTTT